MSSVVVEGFSALSMSSSEDSLGPHCAGEETLAATRREPRSAYAQARNAPLAPLSSYSALVESEEEEADNCLSRERPEPSGTTGNHLDGPRGEIRSGGVARHHLQVAPTPWGTHACPSRRSRWRSEKSRCYTAQ